MTEIAIIGAGMAGLVTAKLLKDHAGITIFEKSRGVSGRMSTRYAEPYFFDHGAQYFTARTAAFQSFIQPLINRRVIERWNARYVKLDGERIIERKDWQDDEPRYVGVPGMNKVAQHLAEGLNVKINTRITSLQQDETWQIHDAQGLRYEGFDWVISTLPSPQAIGLLPEAFDCHTAIKAVTMRPCFSLMLGFSEKLPLEFDAAHVINADISWLAVNSHKPGRPDLFTLMVHSSESYAEAHIDDDHEKVVQQLCDETSQLLGHDVSTADYKTVHGWRYANNAGRENQPVFLDQDLKLAACGDWCLGGRVEGAFTSAYNLANTIKENHL